MSNIIKIINPEELDSEATSWVVKLDGQRLSAEEFSCFKEWYNQCNSHAEAFAKVASMWGNLDVLSELPLLTSKSVPKAGWHEIYQNFSRSLLQPQFSAVFGLLLVVTLSLFYFTQPPRPHPPEIYSTLIGHNKNIDLPDGSKILLNTDSQVEVQYTQKRRILKLLKGEAHFKVAHNAARPFEVYAGTNIVRAVGTAFSVELLPENIEVVVTEGRVQLASLHKEKGRDTETVETQLALVSSGQSAIFADEIETISSLDPEEVDRRLAWRSGSLVFNGEALEDVIAEVSRYTKMKIVISDPQIRKLKIGGYFKTNETEAMLQALETSFGVSVKYVSDNIVYLSKATDE